MRRAGELGCVTEKRACALGKTIEMLGSDRLRQPRAPRLVRKRGTVVDDSIVTAICGGYRHCDGFALGPAETGWTEHDRSIKVKMGLQRFGVEAVGREDMIHPGRVWRLRDPGHK